MVKKEKRYVYVNRYGKKRDVTYKEAMRRIKASKKGVVSFYKKPRVRIKRKK